MTATAAPEAISRRKLLRHYAGLQRRRIYGLLLLSMVMSLGAALQPLPLMYLIDNALGENDLTGLPHLITVALGLDDLNQRQMVIVAGVLVAFIGMTFAIAGAVRTWMTENIGQRLTIALMRDQVRHLHRLSGHFHATHQHGDLMSRIQWDSMSVYTLVLALLVTPLTAFVTMATVGWSAWRLSAPLTLVILAFAPVLALVSARIAPRLKEASKKARNTRADSFQFVTEVLRALPTVQSYTAQDRNTKSYRSVSTAAVRASRQEAWYTALSEALGSLVSSIGAAVVLVVGGNLVVGTDLTIGALVVFIAYTDTLRSQAEKLMGLHRTYVTSSVSLDRTRDVLNSDDRIISPSQPRAIPNSARPPQLVLYEVTVGYDPDRPVLQNIDLFVESGSLTAIVGPTGSGKSTLVSLIPRLIDPWSGLVLWKYIDIRSFDLSELRRHVAIVRQDPTIFAGTIGQNIAIGCQGANRQDVEKAAKLARIDGFIRSLPEGYMTLLGEHGTTLSGGQRQRLAIARALVRPAPVIILDEPTSALDPESEQAITETLSDLRGQRTTIVIAHRISTIATADTIVVLEDGRITESGTHDALLLTKGSYSRLHELGTEMVS